MNFIERSGLEDYYLNITGTQCKFCSSPIFVNDNFTVVKCSNPQCPRKVSGQIQKILLKTGVKGYGIATCKKMLEDYNYKVVTDFLINPPPVLSEVIQSLISEIDTLTLAIQLLEIPTYSTLAAKMFNDFNCYESFIDEVQHNYNSELDLICMKYYGAGVLSSNVSTVLRDYEEDFYNLDTIFNFSEADTDHIKSVYNICISEAVNSKVLSKYYKGKITKPIAIKLLNYLFNDRGIKFIFSKNFTRDVDYLLFDAEVPTNKSVAAQNRGVLMGTDQFIQAILNSLKGDLPNE